MPEGRLRRTRAAYSDLPRGVIVDWTDDGAVSAALRRGDRLIVPGGREDATSWRAPHENAAERLNQQARPRLRHTDPELDALLLDAIDAQRTGEDTI